MKLGTRWIRRFAVVGFVVSAGVAGSAQAPQTPATPAGQTPAQPAAQADTAGKWDKEMAAFEQQDRTDAPAPGGVVFVGSSSIRLWDLKKSFPDLPVVNRGFGGSQIADAVQYVDLLVIRHKPRTVVFYSGDNDIAAGKSPETVAADYQSFVSRVRAALPDTRLVFIGIKPSIQRWALVDKVRAANALVRKMCEGDDRLGYVDVDGPMLGWDEAPRKELFIQDGLHMTPKGYEIWTMLVRAFVE